MAENVESKPALSVRTPSKKGKLLLALAETDGNVSEACRLAGINRKTFYTWIKTDLEFATQVQEVPEVVKDKMEHKLITLALAGNVTALIFWLKSKAKDRGYGDELAVKPIREEIRIEEIPAKELKF
ncbi:MAG: helix-turn-helix domain-containing protein [Leptolyngbyaceae bacterium]|nr:helix-turn-helix domain-containing protein [Leptolyngbyaceae bacterium]